MLKRAAEDPYAPPVPLKRRSVEIDPALRAEWRRSAEHQQQAISSSPPSSQQHQTSAAAVDAISGLTADDWSCAHELNALFTANAHNFPSIVVRSRTTFTRADTAAVAARIASSPSATAAAETCGGQQRRLPPPPHSAANQHLALAAPVLSVAFAPFPTAAMSLYEIEAPSWLAAWARKWCGNGSAAAVAPATPRNSPAASCNSLSSYDSDESGGASSSSSGGAVVVKLMALHGYAEGQPACGQGAGLGEPQTGGGKPARTVFLPIW